MNEFRRRLLDAIEYSDFIATFADPTKKILGIESYAYTVDEPAANLAPGALPSPFNLVMDSDSDFVLTYLSGCAVIGTSSPLRSIEYDPSITVQITDQSSGKTFFNMATPMVLIAGAMGYPFILTSPKVVRPRATLTVAASTIAQATVTYVGFFFTLHGAKIYYA